MSELSQDQLLNLVNSKQIAPGSDRVRALTQRIVSDLFHTIDEMDVTPDEFWAAVDWLGRLGSSGQLGLITAGLGFDRLLDIRATMPITSPAIGTMNAAMKPTTASVLVRTGATGEVMARW